ncbi:hypothetical protein PRNP1_015354 [Phytophthora ramorum]
MLELMAVKFLLPLEFMTLPIVKFVPHLVMVFAVAFVPDLALELMPHSVVMLMQLLAVELMPHSAMKLMPPLAVAA